MRAIIIFLLLLCSFSVNAQAPNWQWAKVLHTHDAGASALAGNVSTSNGKVYMSGCFIDTVSTDTFTLVSSGMHDIFVGVFDSLGTLEQLRSYGGSGEDYGKLRIDAFGNLYLIGTYQDSMLLCGQYLIGRGENDIMMTEFVNLDSLKWVKTMGGGSNDAPNDLIFDTHGNIYLCGYYALNDGNGSYATFEADTLIVAGQGNGFIAKFDSSGILTRLVHDSGTLTYGGGNFVAMSFDTNYHINTTGAFLSKSWYGSIFLQNLSPNAQASIGTLQYDSTLMPIWGQTASAVNPIEAGFGYGTYGSINIKTDHNGNSYIVGNNYNINMQFGTVYVPFVGDFDGFLAKYSADGTFIWARVIGGESSEQVSGLDLDSMGNVYVAGSFWGDINLGNDTLTSNGYSDIFVAKLDSSGNYLWATSAGGSLYDDVYDLAVDKTSGNIFVNGYFDSYDLKFGNTTLSSSATTSNDRDAFIAELNYKPVDGVNTVTAKPGSAGLTMTVSPNPASTFCKVQFGGTGFEWVDVEDMSGHVLKRVPVAHSAASVRIDVTDVATGLYLLKASGGNGTVVEKLNVIH